jgi:hypothetical protein
MAHTAAPIVVRTIAAGAIALALVSGGACHSDTKPSTGDTVAGAGRASASAAYDLDKRVLSDAEVAGLTAIDARLKRNLIYAVHERQFKDPFLTAYFTAYLPGYHPRWAVLDSALSATERDNLARLKVQEQRAAAARTHAASRPPDGLIDLSKLDQHAEVHFHVDLTGDGTDEIVTFHGEPSNTAGDLPRLIIEVNGTALFGPEYLSPNAAFGKIDAKEKRTQLLIGTPGPSSDFATRLYEFDGMHVTELGTVGGMITHGLHLDGSGTVKALGRGRILETWFYDDFYTLGPQRKLLRLPREVYPLQKPTAVTLKQNVPLWKERGHGSAGDGGTIASGARGTIDSCDDKEWCHIVAGSSKGWFHLRDEFVVDPPGMQAAALFDGLVLAD